MTTILLSNLIQQINRIGYPTYFIIGNIAGVIGLSVFLRKTMRRNPCGLFLIAYMITNIVFVNIPILITALDLLFQINPIRLSSIICRIYYHLTFALSIIPSYLLSMATIDRALASSHNVSTRLRSTQRFAKLMIAIIVTFWIIFNTHAYFTVDLQIINSVQLICAYRPGFSTTFISYYSFICVGIIPLSLMIGFSIQILINIKGTHVRQNQMNNNRRVVILLIIQVAIYLCLRLPTPCFLIYKEITKFDMKSTDRLVIEQFVQTLVYFCQFIQISSSPLLNLASKTFRKELKLAWNRIRRRTNRLDTNNAIRLQVNT